MKNFMKRVLVMLLTFVVVLTGIAPGGVHAASAIGTVTISGNTKSYTDLGALVNDVKGYKDQTIRIEMLADWGNVRLCIPQNSNTTLNMNGHMYNRGLSSYKSDGEVIWIDSKATMTINGGSAGTSHSVGVYTGTSTGSKNNTTKTFKGGVIAGGYSSNGAGGIDIKSEVTLTMNDVTLAGCRAEQNWGTDGYGGGIWVHGGTSTAGTVRMNNSTITGCYAYNDGGGIYQTNHNNFTLEMKNSHIDQNFCDDEGGGIALDGESLSITGDDESTVSGNAAGDDGGGIYIWNDSVSVSNLTIANNRSGGKGGGICTNEEGISLTNLTVTGNEAKEGGGLYINNDGSTVNGCTVTGNKASDKGGGLYTDGSVDEKFKFTGPCVFKDNTNGDLRLRSSDRANFTLGRGADVRVLFDDPKDGMMVSEGSVGDTIKNTNCIRFMTCANSGYWFTFNNEPNQRKIYLESKNHHPAKGEAYDPNTEIAMSSEEAAPKVWGTYQEGGKEYDLLRGFFTYPSMESGDADGTSVFYYSDGYFAKEPEVYSNQLATASWALKMASQQSV